MIGYVITYKVSGSKERVLFNHALYGRLSYKVYKGRKIAYYFCGMLDNVRFSRLVNGKVFVEHTDSLNLEKLREYGNIDVAMEDRDIETLGMVTGREYWFDVAREKQLPVRVIRMEARNVRKNG